ncbi:unnamed protein product [Arabis nemorensis]|uniref:F-box domain-containing protein n=1 Tax=Arabis nemorensis TaxID=586526 RepID=A0A565CWC6_9BRAS|nr:unnamed protein product [Arabis nemorensis]
MGKFSDVSDDILDNIMSRLPAKPFAVAACVSRLWNRVSDSILLRPRLASGLSVAVSPEFAVDEALEMALSKPIRPHFVIAFVALPFHVDMIHNRIKSKIGSNTIHITSAARGLIGTNSLTNKLEEVNWAYDEVLVNPVVRGISLEPPVAMVDKFLSDVRDFTVSVSGDTNPDPVGIMLFGVGLNQTVNQKFKPILAEIDTKISRNTVMIGDAYNYVACTSPSISNLDITRNTLDAVALVSPKITKAI